MKIYSIFGATGDLAQKKLIKALFEVYKKEEDFAIYCFGRKDITNEDFRNLTLKNNNIEGFESFSEKIFYFKLDFDLENPLLFLREKFCNSIFLTFYVALPPTEYLKILGFLNNLGLGFQYFILLEKPFGYDKKSAILIQDFYKNCLKGPKLLYVDHYLFKEFLVRINSFKISKKLSDLVSNIREVQALFLESNSLENRGFLYDKIGAVLDVGQNHVLQMLVSFFALDNSSPKNRLEVLKKIESVSALKRGQYKSFKEHLGVSENSETETYFKVNMIFDSGIPILVEAGKSCLNPFVGLKLYFKNGEVVEFKSSNENSYIKLFQDLDSLNFDRFVSFEEVSISFDIAEKIKNSISNLPLSIYNLSDGLC